MRAQSSPSSRKRRWLCAAVTTLATLLLIVFIGSLIIAHVAERKLAALVQKRMDATLVVGRCSYWPPYTLTLHGVKLLTPPGTEAATVLTADKLQIKLAAFPRQNRLLRIDDIAITHPVLNLSGVTHGPTNAQSVAAPHEQQAAPQKLSEQVRLTRFTVTNGEIMYEGQALPGLAVEIKNNRKNAAEYAYTFAVNKSSPLRGESAGTFDIDQALLSVEKLHLTLPLDAAHPPDYLPASWKTFVANNHVSGSAEVAASGQMPLQHLDQATFSAQARLSDIRADNSEWPAPLDNLTTSLQFRRAAANNPAQVEIADFHASSGPATLRLNRGTFSADPKTRKWSVTEIAGVVEGNSAASRNTTRVSRLSKASRRYAILGRVDFTAAASGTWPVAGQHSWPVNYLVLAYARNSSLVVPSMQAPIDRINGGPITFTDQRTTVNNLSAHYGDDVLQIASARLNFFAPQAGQGISAIDADLTFNRNSPAYPPAVEKYMDQIHPQGTFHATGRCVVFPAGFEPRYNYAFDLTSPDVSFAIGSDLFPIDHADFAAKASGEKIQLTSLRGSVLGGSVKAGGEINMQQPITISAHADFADVDVRQAYDIIASGGGRRSYKINQHASGQATGDVHVENKGMDWRTLTGGGTCEITGGNFGDVPILTQLAGAAHISNVDFQGSEAAADFTVAQNTVRLSNAAISAPAIGIQGDGEVQFDGTLHLHAVVAPLADWRQKLKSTGIPLIGDAAGVVQTILNRATRYLFYEFHVTGNIRKPKVTTVPVPILTKKSGRLFADMLRSKHKENLLQRLHIEATTQP